ncbi:hypothetical protein ACP70R_029691 [Stipagrostis hirtigluma subsp. patula]
MLSESYSHIREASKLPLNLYHEATGDGPFGPDHKTPDKSI